MLALRVTKVITSIACLSLLGTFTRRSVAADEMDDARYKAQLETNDLLDREKILLKQEDDISRTIYETKQKIKYLADELDAQIAEQNRIRHQLIITRLKLMH